MWGDVHIHYDRMRMSPTPSGGTIVTLPVSMGGSQGEVYLAPEELPSGIITIAEVNFWASQADHQGAYTARP